MDGLVLEGVRLLRAESVATTPAVANTYAAARAGGARAGRDSTKISAESSSLVPIVVYTSQHEGIALHQVSAAVFDRALVFAGPRDCRKRPDPHRLVEILRAARPGFQDSVREV